MTTLPQPPSVLMPGLYAALWSSGAIRDMKRLADSIPRASPARIEAAFSSEQPDGTAALHDFVDRWFEPPAGTTEFQALPGLTMSAHIERLWQALVREPRPKSDESSLLPLGHAHIVPGGMFREAYYWDSYFTLIGLGEDRQRLRHDCVAALAEQIDRFGHIPNGNRSYYLSRSQPPTFYASVAALQPAAPEQAWSAYLPQLLREHRYWMSGEHLASFEAAVDAVVRMPDGSMLNRYWDAAATPREEAAHGRDVRIADAAVDRERSSVYRDIRAACASGWDFSSRWYADRRTIATIRTTSILPVDLNALLYGLEKAIAAGALIAESASIAHEYEDRAAARCAAMNTWLWNDVTGVFDDFDIELCERRGAITAAAFVPLFAGCATFVQAQATAEASVAALLAPGGLRATAIETGEQWDAPNGWAPSHWMAVAGLESYGLPLLAEEIARRWLGTVARVYAETGRMMEKYDVERELPGGGGEYPLQDGFGWTNGVTAALLARYPDLSQFGLTTPVDLVK